VRRVLNIRPSQFAPQRLSTDKEQMAARERMFEALHPRTGPPPPKWVHVPPRSERDPGTKPLPTIAEAMAALSGRRGPG
jgi:hypothetical protein